MQRLREGATSGLCCDCKWTKRCGPGFQGQPGQHWTISVSVVVYEWLALKLKFVSLSEPPFLSGRPAGGPTLVP